MKTQKSHTVFKTFFVKAILLGLLAGAMPARAQYETTLTTGAVTENFDELGVSSAATLPTGWVFAQGVTLPIYSATLTCQVPPFQFLGKTIDNCQSCTREYDGGASGGTGNTTGTPTGGARVNYGDFATAADRAVGFMSLNSSTGTDYRSPTNYLMYGFFNNTGSNIVSFAVTNNIKMFRQSSLTTFGTAAKFFYSYDGSNWVAAAAGNTGTFPTGTSTYYFSAPYVTNVSFTLSGLNISNNTPFYVAWQFVIANSSGSGSAGLALDDVGLTATFGTATPAVTDIWTNGAGNWNVAANWRGATLPASGDSLTFAGTGGSSVNNLAAISTGTGSIGFLSFSNSAGSYTLSGNGVSLAGGITNNSTVTQTLNLPLTLLGDETFSAAAGGLIFPNIITNGGFGLTFAGANGITLSGSATGNGTLTMAGAGTLLLNGSNTYSGTTAVNTGTVQLGAADRIPDGSAVSVSTGATLDLNNFNETVASVASGGSVTLGNASLVLASGTGSFSGNISGNGGITKNGTGTQTFTATNLYHGGTTVTSGTLAIGAAAIIGDGQINLAGGAFQTTGTRDVTNSIVPNKIVISANTIIQNTTSATAGTRNFPLGGTVIATNGTLTIQNITTGNFTNIIHVRLHGSVTNFTQPIVFDNSLAGNGQSNNTCELGSFNTNGSAPQLFSGNISGPGKFLRSSLLIGGGGVSILTGSNTFTLGTTVDRGYVGLGSDTVSSGGSVIGGPAGTGLLEVDDDTVGGQPGVGFFAYGGARVIGNRILLNGVANTVIGGTNSLTLAGVFDVGGVAKILTVSNTAVTTISGQFTNTANFIKAGAGTLALTADNGQFWSGAMTVSNGTLAANNATGSATGTNVLTVAGGSLTGTGFITSPVVANVGGSVTPGNSVGILTVQNGLDASGGGALVWNLGANSTASAGVNFSQLAVTGGVLKLGGTSVLTLVFTGSATTPLASTPFWQVTHSWRIATLAGGATISGANFSTISNGSYAAGTFTTTTDASGVLLTFTPGSGTPNPPVIGRATLTGTSLRFYITNGSGGASYQIITSTNLTTASGSWPVAASGSFANDGTVTNTITINPTEPMRFYRIKL